MAKRKRAKKKAKRAWIDWSAVDRELLVASGVVLGAIAAAALGGCLWRMTW